MENGPLKPDWIAEVSWEVCNKVGGIHTVLSTKAKVLQNQYKDRILFIGPDLKGGNSAFTEVGSLLLPWRKKAATEGHKIRVGRWEIPGRPIVILVDFTETFKRKDQIYTDLWNWYGVDSLPSYGDYDEACMFAWASAEVILSLYHFNQAYNPAFVAHFNEWTTGAGLLCCKHFSPEIATVFTTHATSIGRSICGNNKPLYDYLPGYNGDQMASELNMVSKHSLEKIAAHQAGCFTTVSAITAVECTQLLEVTPQVVTPNGFEDGFVPKGRQAATLRKEARKKLTAIAEALCGCKLSEKVLFTATSGRYEFRNKGLDVFAEALNMLRKNHSFEGEMVGFVLVPADVTAPRTEVLERLEQTGSEPAFYPWVSHWLNNIESDSLLNKIQSLGFGNSAQDKVKIIFVPCYLNGNDGLINMPYYDVLPGFDLTVFPSYYEPWGYTPLESIAFGVPTVTTSLAGFGAWAAEEGAVSLIPDGVQVVERNDHNAPAVASVIAETLLNYAVLPEAERKTCSRNAAKLAEKAHWTQFIGKYNNAFDVALKNKTDRNKQ